MAVGDFVSSGGMIQIIHLSTATLIRFHKDKRIMKSHMSGLLLGDFGNLSHESTSDNKVMRNCVLVKK